MKINDTKTGMLDSLVRANQVKTAKEKGVDGKADGNSTDKVELSGRKEEIQRIADRVKAAPDVRQEKVERIQSEVAAGTYNVKGQLVARSILKSQLLDEIL